MPLTSEERTLQEGTPLMILCTYPDHATMPEHYHPRGQWDSRFDKLEAFVAEVRKALSEGGLNIKGQLEVALENLDK